METLLDISPPRDDTDAEGARRTFEDFLTLYKPTLERVEDYLESIIEKEGSMYGVAYSPWQEAIHDLLRGVYLMSRKIPLPNKEDFTEALRMFSFESAIKFLRDVCLCCRIALKTNWEEKFREHINMLLFSLSILNRQQQCSPVR